MVYQDKDGVFSHLGEAIIGEPHSGLSKNGLNIGYGQKTCWRFCKHIVRDAEKKDTRHDRASVDAQKQGPKQLPHLLFFADASLIACRTNESCRVTYSAGVYCSGLESSAHVLYGCPSTNKVAASLYSVALMDAYLAVCRTGGDDSWCLMVRAKAAYLAVLGHEAYLCRAFTPER